MGTVRTFLAVPLPEEVSRTAHRLCRELAGALPGVRWARPETMHLTLRFFGDIPEESLEKIGEVMLSVGRRYTPFQVTLAGVGAFPSVARPRVVWLGLRGGEPLTELYSALENRFEQAGFPREGRSFSPHLTLGRCRGPIPAARTVLDRYRETVIGLLMVEKIVLFESRLHPAGAVHLPREIVVLGQ